MKKILIISFILALGAFLSSCSSDGKETFIVVPPAKAENKSTTVMVYFEGSNLESDGGAASENIEQMVKAVHTDYLKVVIQTGASDINYDIEDTIPPEFRNKPAPYVRDWTRVQRHNVTATGINLIEDLGISCNETAGITNNCTEMGSADTLKNFIEASVKDHPADRYVLVLWDHGGGPIGGYGGSPAKSMSINDIKKAIDNAKDKDGKKIELEIIGFDACLMAAAEYAYNLKSSAKYLVASEELEPGEGWNYSTILTAIAKNPKMTGADIGRTIADSFLTSNKNEGTLTLSVTDLSKIDSVVNDIDALSRKTIEMFEKDNNTTWNTFFKARNDSEEFGADVADNNFVLSTDIGAFARALEFYDNASYAPYTNKLVKSIEDAVVYNVVGNINKSSTGLSLWIPFHFDSYNPKDLSKYKALYDGKDLSKFSDTYILLIEKMLNYAKDTPSTFTPETAVVDNDKVKLKINSNFGVDDAILLANISADPDVFQPIISTIAEITDNKTSDYIATADFDEKIFVLNTYPIYTIVNGRPELKNRSKYVLSIPLYYQENGVGEQKEVTMTAMFDFSTGTAEIDTTLVPADSTGKDSIKLKIGDILTIPTVTVTPENGDVTITPSTDKIIVEFSYDGGSDNLKLERTENTNTSSKYAFLIKNLRGDVSKAIEVVEAAPVSLKTVADDKKMLDALSEALMKPFWTK